MQIEITDTDFHRLQSLAVPLIDTPATVISRLLDFYETNKKAGEAEKNNVPINTSFIATETPPLSHTRLLMAKFDGVEPKKLYWNDILQVALAKGLEKAKSTKELGAISGINLVDYIKNDQGYKYLDELNLSYQGVSAKKAVESIRRLSKYLGVKCEFKFEWLYEKDAHMPGQVAYGYIEDGLLKVSWNKIDAKY